MDPTTHPFDREDVMAYLDGELQPERAAAAAAHLEHCAECRELAARLRSISSQLPKWEVEMIPATVEQNVLRAANEKPAQVTAKQVDQPAPSRGVVRWWLWGSAMAAAAMILLVVSLSLPMNHRAPSSPEPVVNAVNVPAVPGPPPLLEKKAAAEQYAQATRNMTASRDTSALSAGAPRAEGRTAPAAPRRADAQSQVSHAQEPMIVRRASLAVLTKEFDAARASLENLVKAHLGYFGQLQVGAPASAGRTLAATIRVPAGQLDPVLVELRKLGKVEQENQSADDVTRQYVDLVARLVNARETEKRLVEILRERTGRVSDVLEVEQEIARTRQEIEQMDAERKNMDSEVRYASVDLRITEEYKQSLETPAPSLGTRVNNAAVEGFRGAAELVIGLVLWLLGTVPTLVVLGAMLAWPVTRLVRWIRQRLAAEQVATAH